MNMSIPGIHFNPHFHISHMLIVLKIQMPSNAASQFVHDFDFLTVSIQNECRSRHVLSSTNWRHYSCVPGVNNGCRFDDGNQANFSGVSGLDCCTVRQIFPILKILTRNERGFGRVYFWACLYGSP